MAMSVGVIVLSYNRPYMLRHAMASIQGADEIIVLDDGSNFDAVQLLSPFQSQAKRFRVKVSGKMSVEERLKVPRLGKAINQAIMEMKSKVVCYLCDDDLFAPSWIHEVRKYFIENKGSHFVRGRWNRFKDFEVPGDEPCPLNSRHRMTTGNFAHMRSCSIEHNLWWDETTVAVHDSSFLTNVSSVHPTGKIPILDTLAGWRREHRNNMMNFTKGLNYLPRAREALEQPKLE